MLQIAHRIVGTILTFTTQLSFNEFGIVAICLVVFGFFCLRGFGDSM